MIAGSLIAVERQYPKKETPTMDIIVLGIGLLFFALSFAYIKACDSL